MSFERQSQRTSAVNGREPFPGYRAWVAANRSRFKTGSVNRLLILHDHGCRFPWGEPCTCLTGPEINVAGVDPEIN